MRCRSRVPDAATTTTPTLPLLHATLVAVFEVAVVAVVVLEVAAFLAVGCVANSRAGLGVSMIAATSRFAA